MLKVNSMKTLSMSFQGGTPTPNIPTEMDIMIADRNKNRSNRNKYHCQSCDIQLWGKPGLSVICGDCDETLYEINQLFLPY